MGDSTATTICDISDDVKEELKKFRFSKSNNAALILKVDREKKLIVVDELIEDVSLEDLQEQLPSHQPRYIIYSYKMIHDDARVSLPMVFIYFTPRDSQVDLQVMYAGMKVALQKEADLTRVYEIRDLDDLTEDWLKEKLKKLKRGPAPLDKDVQELINAAVEARKRAYIPYSGFAVGSALRSKTGEIFTGCNIENAAFAPSICAERTALAKAVSEGHREFTACVVIANQEKNYTAPCGVCRQTLIEFVDKDIPVYLAKPVPVNVLITSLFTLLPAAFIPKNFTPTPTNQDKNLNFK
uniref:cytidine deaminase n=1 Tax=Culicoides sonorensis TaxID=179676 RepID=A0A336MIW9_CULSO